MLTPSSGLGKSIIVILAEEPGLTVKQLYVRALRQQQRVFSYQALHKKITALVNDGILQRTESGYSINPHWLTQLAAFVDETRQKSGWKDQIVSENAPISTIHEHFRSRYGNQRTGVR